MKPYQQVEIQDCREPLVEIPTAIFAIENPHPYLKLSAPYGEKSPYFLRQTVLERLIAAQDQLQLKNPGWRIQIFDAYRPIAVQQFMVNHAFATALEQAGLTEANLTETQRQAIWSEVYQFWALPSLDPATPPPHSTGAAIDVTLVNAAGQCVDMGTLIDEMSPRSHPDYYASVTASQLSDRDQCCHQHRSLLRQVMTAAGFEQHPNEWWHFSYGDQLWAWRVGQKQNNSNPELSQNPKQNQTLMPIARYGLV